MIDCSQEESFEEDLTVLETAVKAALKAIGETNQQQ